MEKEEGFKPVFDKRSKLLILGSFPSVVSRKTGFYYGNRQNRFWKVLAEALSCPEPHSNEEKRALVLSHGIALWDIVGRCRIVGSMDSDIRDYECVDLSGLIRETRIERILCNGARAYEIFCAHFQSLVPIARKMPSTSSANVRFDKSVWIEELSVCKEIKSGNGV